MPEFDLTFPSSNSIHYPKRVTAWIVEPDQLTPDTGLLHCCHGWGGNRFQYADLMRDFANRYNLLGVATEFRQSGHDFDPTTGRGSSIPYDASHVQVLDCLNAVRETLRLFPGLNRRRLLAFGGSQGGHITMLMTVFAPRTFAAAISGSGIAWMDPERIAWTGRDFSADELAVRDTVRLAPHIRCPVVLMHGTADATVPDSHTRALEDALRAAGKVQVITKYYPGGGHGLEPVSNRKDATIELADDLLRQARLEGTDDFQAGRRVVIPAVTRQLVLDWSRPVSAPDVMRWEQLTTPGKAPETRS